MKIKLFLGAWLMIATTLFGADKPKADKVIEFKKVGNVTLSLHVYDPPGHKVSDNRPAIVLFFGGGWKGGDPSHFAGQAKYLSTRGMVAICADYRTAGRHKTTPDRCVSDGKSAIRWVRIHAAELGIDPNMIAAGGGSAGGHVATTTAVIEAFNEEGEDTSVSSKPKVLVLFNPVIDNGPEGYGYERVKEHWEKFSPLHNIKKGMPPTIMFLGTKDALIPVSTGEAFKKKVEEVGGACELVLYKDMGHGFFNKIRYNNTLYRTDKFLVKHGFLTGEPTIKENQ